MVSREEVEKKLEDLRAAAVEAGVELKQLDDAIYQARRLSSFTTLTSLVAIVGQPPLQGQLTRCYPLRVNRMTA